MPDIDQNEMSNPIQRRQGIFWLLTIPHASFVPYLPPQCVWILGQLEKGNGTGYLHWQVMVAFSKKASLAQVKQCFGDCHAELSRSEAAVEYCRKEDTRVEGTDFELGSKPFRRNSKRDWESVWTSAKSGDLEAIPADIRVVSYRTIRAIGSDYSKAIPMERNAFVFWGPTGTGKSRRAWEEAGMDAYCKDPRTKFWDGYQNESNVVVDEFRGGIDISHLLRWLDRYPVRVEIKGASRVLKAKTFWFTSNLDPRYWYRECDPATIDALMRRLTIVEFT